MAENQFEIAYAPRILRNLTEICAEMGVGTDKVKLWVSLGAPIAVSNDDGRARYSAEAAALQLWRVREGQ